MARLLRGKCCHSVHNADPDRHLGRLRTDAARPQTITRKYFKTVHRVLDERTQVIAAALLPFASAVSCEVSNRLVAPACAGHALRPRLRHLVPDGPEDRCAAWNSRACAPSIHLRRRACRRAVHDQMQWFAAGC
jgi:hypothetical protein